MEVPLTSRAISIRPLLPPKRSPASFYPLALLTPAVRRSLSFPNPKQRLLRASAKDSAPLINGGDGESDADGEGFVEVVGIGSRKDAVIDFCLDSRFRLASSLRFWNVNMKDTQGPQLQEKRLGEVTSPRMVDVIQFLQFSSKAVILVASAGYGTDYVIAKQIFEAKRSSSSFVVAIFLKPFSFEGQRRQEEMKDLILKLRGHTSFCIDIDTDKLLKKDLVTLDEALKTANSAVLLAINAIFVLISRIHRKLFDVPQNDSKYVKTSEVMKIIEQYEEAKVGFGAGGSIKSSISQALYDCPFIGSSLEDFKGIVICIIASSGVMEDCDINSFLYMFRRMAKYSGEIVVSTAREFTLESNIFVTTVLTVGCTFPASQNLSILSGLARHFPFVFKLFGGQQSNEEGRKITLEDQQSSMIISTEFGAMEDVMAEEGEAATDHKHSENHGTVSSINFNGNYGPRNCVSGAEETSNGFVGDHSQNSNFYNQMSEGTPYQREQLTSWNLGPGYQNAKEWAKERAGATPVLDDVSIFCLPVGVKPSEELKDDLSISPSTKLSESKSERIGRRPNVANLKSSSWDTLTDAGLEAMRDLYGSASSLFKAKIVDVPKKQGVLSVRAASMLEAERDLPKKWSPVMEMQYRGGVYRGRCQGGLPEGKGRLIFDDGSIYDGMWRYGKRSGSGAFYFSNGDVFQGLWRDDMMHGKGWFYFHTGDRWFANFWKGKANGESRFFSKSGDVFFGHFQNGWRHGQFLCIGIDGERCIEQWEEGVLLGRKQLDSDSGAEGISTTFG